MIKIFGARGNVKEVDIFLKKILNFVSEHHFVIQLFDAYMIFGKTHLLSSVEHAVRAMERGTNTANSLDMEILLYASGEKQLKLAIPKMGIKKGNSNIGFVIVDDIIDSNDAMLDRLIDKILKQFSLVRDDEILEGDIETLRRFGLNGKEIKTVVKTKHGHLILEKVALVDIIK